MFGDTKFAMNDLVASTRQQNRRLDLLIKLFQTVLVSLQLHRNQEMIKTDLIFSSYKVGISGVYLIDNLGLHV